MPQQPNAGGRGSSAAPGGSSPINRRRFLQMTAAGAVGAGAALVAGGDAAGAKARTARHSKKPSTAPAEPAVRMAALPSGVLVPTAPWLITENQRTGSIDWICNHPQPDHALEGFASHVSAVSGDEVTLFVNTSGKAVQVQAYRMGYYQGIGGRLVWQSDTVAAGRQPPPTVTPGLNTVSCPWSPTLSFTVDQTWPPGCYLLKLLGDGGLQQYVPLTIRDDASVAAYVFQNSVTTWQAYNLYGGYSLYYGQAGKGRQDFAHRARAVSFDRPIVQRWSSGAADFIGNELPLLYYLERFGVDLTYWTDIDLHANPALLTNHNCLFSLGHDEYWSAPMRVAAQAANANGVNLAFLGANASYRQIRLEPTSIGPNRLQVCYKSAAEDPMAKQDPTLTTVNWNQSPVNNPESLMIGSTYQSVGAQAPMVATDPSSWFFDGCNLTHGQALPDAVIGEYDRFVPSLPGPRNLDVLMHSPIPGQNNWSDVTYFTAGPTGGGVLASGSAYFVNRLANSKYVPPNVLPYAVPGTTDILLRAMDNLLGRFGLGPAGMTTPSGGNWEAIYAGATAGSGSPKSTNAS
ncbi:MAG TPA: N,N-dimethylformamidase beta subunit family domain-containing protein [Acidimicrobiales bacterium]|nr:N,N-dimethylformamidase beta subunit family domain-containing protein [Acidimicrobiales bacterium]